MIYSPSLHRPANLLHLPPSPATDLRLKLPLSSLVEENREIPDVEVDEVLGLCESSADFNAFDGPMEQTVRNVRSEVAAHDAVPGVSMPRIKLGKPSA